MFEALWTGLAGSFEAGVLPAIGIAGFRAFVGWLENSLEDGKLQAADWQKLGKTFVTYIGGILILSQGLPLETSIAGIFALDLGKQHLQALKK